MQSLLSLSPAALRLDRAVLDKLHKLGLYTIDSFIRMPRSSLRRRFGQNTLLRIDQALGTVEEILQPVMPVESYQERLPCLEPIMTVTGIEIALQRLLEALCDRLKKEGRGLRSAVFKGYRTDGKLEQICIGTNRASHNVKHLFKLFELNIQTIEPALGIELFMLEAPKLENVTALQEALWRPHSGLEDNAVAELLDRITGRFGTDVIHRYLPDEHYWPERSFKKAAYLQEKPGTQWRTDQPRPIQLLPSPEPIEVAAPIPDYPPMHFRYRGRLHKIKKADGPRKPILQSRLLMIEGVLQVEGEVIHVIAKRLFDFTTLLRGMTATDEDKLPVLTLSRADEKTAPATQHKKTKAQGSVVQTEIFPAGRNFK